MSAVVSDRQVDPQLTDAFLAHLAKQIESARRMLAVVVEQGAAIRRRDVQNVVRLAGSLQVEMHRREVIELERERLLGRAADQLGLDSELLSLADCEDHVDPESARVAHALGAELNSLLAEIQREHQSNRALMQQELAFLDHLLQLVGGGGSGAYDSGGDRSSRSAINAYTRKRVFDLEA